MASPLKRNGFHPAHSQVWQTLSTLLPARNEDCDYWWEMTGGDLANMVDAAGYSIEKQYDALLFHYHWIVPFMGPAPGPGVTFDWPCVLSLEGLPVEYSWKWNTSSRAPEIRYCIEAKNHLSGTAVDPLNQEASREMLHRLSKAFPGIDLSWTNHFLATLYDHDRSKYAQESASGPQHTTTIMIAIEFKSTGLRLKTYLIPRKHGIAQIPISLLQKSISGVCPTSKAADALFNFMESTEGRYLSPTMLAVDNVQPTQSRLKLYLQSPQTNFTSTRQIMTLGGLIPVPETSLDALRSLIHAVAGVDPAFPDDAELPVATQYHPPVDAASNDKTLALPGFGFYFDIAPGNAYPEIKLFVRLCVNGPDDARIGKGLTAWMEAQGRGAFAGKYTGMLEKMSRHRRLEDGKGVHTHVSCLFQRDGELEVTSYLTPETAEKRSMLRAEG